MYAKNHGEIQEKKYSVIKPGRSNSVITLLFPFPFAVVGNTGLAFLYYAKNRSKAFLSTIQ